MREIKFRAWCKKDKKMFEWHQIGLESYGVYQLRPDKPDGDIRYWDADLELMQYTGLKDRNSKDIFEGDIVKWNGENRVVDYCTDYSCGCYELDKHSEGLGGVESGNPENWFETEVIGNIYENPELI